MVSQWRLPDRRIGQLLTLLVPRQVVLTGAPGAGKTTLLDAAAAAGLTTSPEVARQLLQQPGGMELRATDPLGFAEAMLEAHAREYERLSRCGGLSRRIWTGRAEGG